MLIFFVCLFIALILLPGTLDLILVTVGAILPVKKSEKVRCDLKNVVVVVPAHNEELSIRSCLDSLQRVDGNVHIVVVADNCDDQTAAIARSCGVEVLERFSKVQRGKPYALTYAFQYLLKKDFTWFVVVDADTSIHPKFLKNISKVIEEKRVGAIQGRYCIRNAGETVGTRLMNIAFNSLYLRMRGKERLGLSTNIQGNGFVLHREIVEKIPLKSEYITEDLAYHLELVMKGFRVQYCEHAEVYADMPLSREGIESQRARWEGGRVRVAIDYLPKLMRGTLRGNYYCAEPILDLLLLPLGYHLLGVILLFALSGFSFISWIYLLVPVVDVFFSIILGGGTFKDILLLATVPYYLVWKLMSFSKTVKSSATTTAWVRTDRENQRKKKT